MARNSAILAVTGAVLVITGCATRPKIPSEASDSAAFKLERDLLGPAVGRGSFKSITGGSRGFTVQLYGKQEGNVFILEEDFEYDDGEKDKKTWRLTRQEDGTYVGVREDVVGEARGYMDGPAFRLEYLIDLPRANGSTIRLGFRDVLILRPDGTVYNKANVGWRGIHAGKVELEMIPQ